MNIHPILNQNKYARIIELYVKKYSGSVEMVLNYINNSSMEQQMSDGLSDLYDISKNYPAHDMGVAKNEIQEVIS